MNARQVEFEDVLCPGCGLNIVSPKASVQLSPIKVQSKLVQCQNCGLFYVTPRPSRQFEKEFYEKEHYQLESMQFWCENRLPFFEKVIQELEKRTQSRQLLDVGCGGGFFLELARGRGWRVKGTELSDGGIQYAKEHLALDVHRGEIYDINLKENSFSAVTLWNVLDQIHDPVRQMAKVYELLEPGGVLALRISNVKFHLTVHRIWHGLQKASFLKEKAAPTVFHLQMFNSQSIRSMLNNLGYVHVEIKNSGLDTKNLTFVELFGAKGAKIMGRLCYDLTEMIRILSFGNWVMSPSIIVYAKKPSRNDL